MIYQQADDLIRASQGVHGMDDILPFDLCLQLDGKPQILGCLEIYRLLPGRRLTLRALMNGQTVVVKLYIGKGYERYWKRELSGLRVLSETKLPTPRLLGHESDPSNGLSFLILEYLPPDPIEQQSTPAHKVVKLSPVLAQMHKAGVTQKDMHLNNFLFAARGIFLIDGDAIAKHAALSYRTVTDNLAALVAQVNFADASLGKKCLSAYLAECGTDLSIDEEVLHKRVRQKRQKRLDGLLGKAQRNCTDYYCTSGFRHFFICERQSFDTRMQSLLTDLDGWVERGERLKSGNTCTVSRVRIDDRSYVIKRYNIKSVGHALNRALRTTRARVSWLNSRILGFYRIPSARIRALYEVRLGPFRRKAYLIMDDLDGELLSEQQQPLSREIKSSIYSTFQKLLDAGLVHGDTKASNFIMLKPDTVSTELRLAVIDLDVLKRFVPGAGMTSDRRFIDAFEKDVLRFLKNFDADSELTDQLSIEALSVTRPDCSV